MFLLLLLLLLLQLLLLLVRGGGGGVRRGGGRPARCSSPPNLFVLADASPAPDIISPGSPGAFDASSSRGDPAG